MFTAQSPAVSGYANMYCQQRMHLHSMKYKKNVSEAWLCAGEIFAELNNISEDGLDDREVSFVDSDDEFM
jgi:hypothetical protein